MNGIKNGQGALKVAGIAPNHLYRGNHIVQFSGSQLKITTVGNKGGKSMTLREEREQFLKEHSEIAKSMFGDRTELSEDEWYELAMATGNHPHPSDV